MDIIEKLRTFLTQELNPEISIAQITKWSRGSLIKITVVLKKKNGFASLVSCEKVHKLVLLWAKKENIQQHLQISIQSESINKILMEPNDFEDNIDKKMKIETKQKINNRRNFTGFLKKIKDGTIYLRSEEEVIELNLSQIKKAQLLLI